MWKVPFFCLYCLFNQNILLNVSYSASQSTQKPFISNSSLVYPCLSLRFSRPMSPCSFLSPLIFFSFLPRFPFTPTFSLNLSPSLSFILLRLSLSLCGSPCRVPNLFIISALCQNAGRMLKYKMLWSGYKWASVFPPLSLSQHLCSSFKLFIISHMKKVRDSFKQNIEIPTKLSIIMYTLSN